MRRSLSWIDDGDWKLLLARSGIGAAPGEGRTAETVAESKPIPKPVPPAVLPFEDQIAQLLDETMAGCGGECAFIADELGLPVANRGTKVELIAAISPLLQGLDQVRQILERPTNGLLTVGLEGGRTLQIAEVRTHSGRFVLGSAGPQVVQWKHLIEVQERLRSMLDSQGERNG